MLLAPRTHKRIGRLRPSVSALFAQQPGTPEPPGTPPQPPPDPMAPPPYKEPPRSIPIPRPEQPPVIDDPSAAANPSRAVISTLLSNPIYTGQIAHKGELHPGPH